MTLRTAMRARAMMVGVLLGATFAVLVAAVGATGGR